VASGLDMVAKLTMEEVAVRSLRLSASEGDWDQYLCSGKRCSQFLVKTDAARGSRLSVSSPAEWSMNCVQCHVGSSRPPIRQEPMSTSAPQTGKGTSIIDESNVAVVPHPVAHWHAMISLLGNTWLCLARFRTHPVIQIFIILRT
jgi:hypothetical protein